MGRQRAWLPLACVICLVATTVFGQTGSSSRVGLGVSVADSDELYIAAGEDSLKPMFVPALLIPIDLTPRFRIEPEVSVLRIDSTTSTNAPGSGSLLNQERIQTMLHLGAGVFGRTTSDRFGAYYGARFAYLRYSASSDSQFSPSRTTPGSPGLLFAPAVGGEYFLGDRFSLGAELQVRFVRWDDQQVEGRPGPTVTTTNSGNSIATRGAFTVRFYFSS